MIKVDRDELLDQLATLVEEFHARARALYGSPALEQYSPSAIARDYAAALVLGGGELAEHAAREVAMALVGERAFDDEAFWRTPLGRVIAWYIGFPRERVQTSLVGTLLGTSRQYGYRAVADLDKELRDGSVTVPSEGVRRLLRVRQRALAVT
jgi:hypothetical protein